jgi:hypothetical protein
MQIDGPEHDHNAMKHEDTVRESWQDGDFEHKDDSDEDTTSMVHTCDRVWTRFLLHSRLSVTGPLTLYRPGQSAILLLKRHGSDGLAKDQVAGL